MIMEKFLYPKHPLRCILPGPSESGKSVFLTNLISIIFNKIEKIYIYSPSLHQDFNQKSFKQFSNYLPVHKIPNLLIEEDIDLVIEEIVNIEDFQKTVTEIETRIDRRIEISTRI